jgi:hypothetical protein
VAQYYAAMHARLDQLHRFYAEDSSLFVAGPSGVAPSPVAATGLHAIDDALRRLAARRARVTVTSVDALHSAHGAVVVVVTGRAEGATGPVKSHRFTQTFVLAPQRGGFYVKNDLVRFLAEPHEPRVVSHERAFFNAADANDRRERKRPLPSGTRDEQKPRRRRGFRAARGRGAVAGGDRGEARGGGGFGSERVERKRRRGSDKSEDKETREEKKRDDDEEKSKSGEGTRSRKRNRPPVRLRTRRRCSRLAPPPPPRIRAATVSRNFANRPSRSGPAGPGPGP